MNTDLGHKGLQLKAVKSHGVFTDDLRLIWINVEMITKSTNAHDLIFKAKIFIVLNDCSFFLSFF